jgi:hypothetical protein
LTEEEAAALFAASPRSNPALAFVPGRCLRVVLHSAGSRVEMTREVGARRRWLRRDCFWDLLLAETAVNVEYVRYQHRDTCDQFTATVRRETAESLRHAARLLAFPDLARQVASLTVVRVDFYVRRS